MAIVFIPPPKNFIKIHHDENHHLSIVFNLCVAFDYECNVNALLDVTIKTQKRYYVLMTFRWGGAG